MRTFWSTALLGSAFLVPITGCEPTTSEGPSMSLSTELLDFGEVPLDSEETLQVTLTNDGGVDFEILSASLIEGRTAIWSVDDQSSGVISSGEVGAIDVSFKPFDQGPEEARIQIRTTLDDFSNLYVVLRGQGAASAFDGDGDGYSPATGDCNDDNANIYPGSEELCDGLDNDCDGETPEDEVDEDYDGYRICSYDCDDTDSRVYPGAPEICDTDYGAKEAKDSDCDGVIQDELDEDGDGYSICDDDCNDEDPGIWPYNPEVCDFIDNDCSGEVDDIDEDGDGYSPCQIGGDCNDSDPWAYPVIVDDDADSGGDGTVDAPFNNFETALEALDADVAPGDIVSDFCRTIVLFPGLYELEQDWEGGYLKVAGAGEYPEEVIMTTSEGSTQRIFDVAAGSSLALENVMLYNTDTNGDGGAIRGVGADIALTNVSAVENRCTGDGGAISVSSGTLTIANSSFQYNESDDDGGAIAVSSSDLIDNGSLYYSNEAVRGGAILIESSQVDLADSEITGNEAEDQGGGIAIVGGSDLHIERMLITENAATVDGGGVSISDLEDEDSWFRNNIVQDNQSGVEGGGVSISGSEAVFMFANNHILGNSTGLEGAGVHVSAEESEGLYIWSNLIGWNDGDSGLYCEEGVGASIAYNTGFSTTSGINFTFGESEDSGNNEEQNPALAGFSNDGDPDNDDWSLGESSPLIDNGPANGEGPTWYVDWADIDGSTNDRGATGGAAGGWNWDSE